MGDLSDRKEISVRQEEREDYTENINIVLERIKASRGGAENKPDTEENSDSLPGQLNDKMQPDEPEQDSAESDYQYKRDKGLVKKGVITKEQFKYKWSNRL